MIQRVNRQAKGDLPFSYNPGPAVRLPSGFPGPTMQTPQAPPKSLFADLMPPPDEPSAPAKPPEKARDVSPLWDTLRSIPSGLRTGAEQVAGLPGDAGYGMRWGAEQLGRLVGSPVDQDYIDQTGEYAALQNPLDFGSSDVRAATTSAVGPAYAPQTTAGEYARTVGEFLPTSFLGPGGAARNALTFGLVPGLASEAAGQATEGTSLEGPARVAGALAGGVGSSLAFGKATAPRTARQAVAEAAERQNVRVPAAALPDKPVTGSVAGLMADMPPYGNALRRGARKLDEGIASRFDDLAGTGSATKADAAHGAREALVNWFDDGSRGLTKSAYDRVDAFVDPTVMTPLTSTQKTARAISDELAASTGQAGRAALKRVDDAISRPEGLTYGGLKNLRTEIGQLKDDALTPNALKAPYKRLYGALSDDLETAVRNAGGDKGLQAWQRANRLNKAVAERRKSLAQIVGAKGDASTNAVFDRIVALTRDSARGNAEALRRVRSTLRPTGAWQDVRSSVVQELGRDPTSPTRQFSPRRFLTSYGKMTDEGKQILFGDAKQHIDDLALISERSREFARSGNASGSGSLVSVAGTGGWVFYDPLAALSGLVGGNTLSVLLARPASAKSVARWARARQNLAQGATPTAAAAYLAATRDVAEDLENETGRPAHEFVAPLNDQPTTDLFRDLM